MGRGWGGARHSSAGCGRAHIWGMRRGEGGLGYSSTYLSKSALPSAAGVAPLTPPTQSTALSTAPSVPALALTWLRPYRYALPAQARRARYTCA